MRLAYLFLSAVGLASAQQSPDVLLHQDFEDGILRWTSMGQGGSLHLSKEPGQAHTGSGALAFSYQIKPRQITGAVLPAPTLAGMQRLSFWLKDDHTSPIGVLLSERKPGGNYVAWVWVEAGEWQQVNLTPEDFLLADGPNDPKDPDGRLDLDQLQGIGVFDLSGLFPTLAGGSMGVSRTIWIDDFDVFAGPPVAPSGMRIDSFDRRFLSWIAANGGDLKLAATVNPLGEPAMQASYEQKEEPFPSLARRLGNFNLTTATRLEFDIASERQATIGIGLELKSLGSGQGPRFNLPVYPPGDREVFHVSLSLGDFQGEGKLDPALLKTLTLTDATAAGSGTLGRNTIWIGKLEFR